MFNLIKRIFRSGWQNLIRNKGINLANIFVMVIILSLTVSLFLLKDASQFIINNLQEKVDLSVYFKPEAGEADILILEEEINSIPEVKEICYISSEGALEKFIEKHKDNLILMESLEEVGANPFLSSFEIKVFESQQYETIVSFLEDNQIYPLIEKIDYYQRKPVIENVYNFTNNLNKGVIIFSIVLLVTALLISYSTTRMSISSSREEIKIQKLVGASNWFVRGPFLAQGIICGFVSTIISSFILFSFSWGFSSKLENILSGFNLFSSFVNNFWLIFLVQLVGGITLGVFSSLIAMRKYLKA